MNAQIVADVRVELDESTPGEILLTAYAVNLALDLDLRSYSVMVAHNNALNSTPPTVTNRAGEDLTIFNATPLPNTDPATSGEFPNLLLIGASTAGTDRYNIPMGTDGILFQITYSAPIARAADLGDVLVFETADAPFPNQIIESDGTDDVNYTVSGILPVELVSFEAEKHEKTNALLTWATSQEINSDYFQIEGSENGYDWAVVGKVAAAGYSNSEIEYSFVEQNVATLGQRQSSVKYYRLRIVDLDRTYDFSDVKSVSFDGRESKGEMAMFPNPSKYGVTIEFDNEKTKEGTIQIFDVSGKNMYNVTTSDESFTQHYIDLQKFNISAGTYMVIVNIDGDVAYSDKLIVQE